MRNGKYSKLGEKTIMLGAIVVALLFVSSATAVPQTHGSVVVEKLDKIEKIETIYSILSEEIDIENLDSDETTIGTVFMLATVTEQISSMARDSDGELDTSAIQNAAEKIDRGEIDEKDVIFKIQDCLNLLSTIIDERLIEKELSNEELIAFRTLKTYVLKLQSMIDGEALNSNISTEKGGDGLLQKLISIILIILLIPFMILKGVISGVIGIITGTLCGIGALIKLVVLLFAGVQSMLMLTAFFVIFIGIMSRIGIKLFAAAGAPIFAIITSRLIPAIGSLLGGLSLAIHSLAALLIILAIPIVIALIVGIIILLLDEEENPPEILALILETISGILMIISPG
ncbi:MAG: hypothetical protein KAJ69_04060 [Thermoplasmatales archaeon]|nr:hypothetical protein [Thermoplasmatales archaeon]